MRCVCVCVCVAIMRSSHSHLGQSAERSMAADVADATTRACLVAAMAAALASEPPAEDGTLIQGMVLLDEFYQGKTLRSQTN